MSSYTCTNCGAECYPEQPDEGRHPGFFDCICDSETCQGKTAGGWFDSVDGGTAPADDATADYMSSFIDRAVDEHKDSTMRVN